MRETEYKIFFKCSNCGDIFARTIPKGQEAKGQGGICPYCGVKDGGSFIHCKTYTTQPRGLSLKHRE